MAKINISLDTITKIIAVDIDGAALKNVSDINIMAWTPISRTGEAQPDVGMCEIRTGEMDEQSGITKITKLYASENGEMKTEDGAYSSVAQQIAKALFPKGM
jgi:hypothetical protein